MGFIPSTDARNLFTRELAATFSDRVGVKSFFRSFFKEQESSAKNISIQVEREDQNIAIDILRSTEGTLNSWDTQTEKIFTPPYYEEKFYATDLEAYESLYVDREISSVAFGKFLKTAANKVEGLYNKIDRAYELQAAQSLLTGIVSLSAGVNIDFKRKAASLIAFGAANDWSLTTVDPNTIILQGAAFIKETGKAEGGTFNIIMGTLAFEAYKNNTFVKARNQGVQYGMDQLIPAQREAVGCSYHGTTSIGSFNFRLWTYPEVYKNPTTGVQSKYMDDKKILILPEITNNVLSYAATPLVTPTAVIPVKGKFNYYELIDPLKRSHTMGVMSAGVAIPVAVDQAFTAQILV